MSNFTVFKADFSANVLDVADGAVTVTPPLTVGSSAATTSTITAASGTVLTLVGNAGGLSDNASISLNGGRAVFGYDGSSQTGYAGGSKNFQIKPTVSGNGAIACEVVPAAASTLTAESVGFRQTGVTHTITGGFATERFALFRLSTITAGSALTVTSAATVAIEGAPAAAGSAVITNAWSLWVQAGVSRFDAAVDINNGVALGGGAAPTVGTIGGSGPATAGQNSWLKVKIAGTDSYLPVWR